jgi:putative toxin-antitoxin system antitoxin component (TIGR02293 family)
MNREAAIKTTVKTTAKSAGKESQNKPFVMTEVQTKRQPEMFFSYKSADDKDLLTIIDIVRNGISYKDFSKIVVDTPFSLTEWANYLQLSERTIQRNQKEKKSFQPIQSERIVEVSMLYTYGVEVFGDKDNFDVWLNSKSISLGGRTPKDLLDTKFGISMVRDELGRIEHGILA